MRKGIRFLTLAVLSISLGSIGCSVNRGIEADVSIITIVSPSDATTAECLAAKEVRRYVYLRTGTLLPIVRSDKKLPSKTPLIIVGQKDRPVIRRIIARNTNLAFSTSSLESQPPCRGHPARDPRAGRPRHWESLTDYRRRFDRDTLRRLSIRRASGRSFLYAWRHNTRQAYCAENTRPG